MIIDVLVAAFMVMLVSLVGVIFIGKTTAKFLEDKLSFLVSFSAGVFLVTAGALTLEVFELADSLWQGALLIVVGYALAFLVHKLMPETHHHHDEHCHAAHGTAARKLIIGDSIHNVADGVILVVAYAASPALGLAALVSIVIHEALQEISEFFVLRRAGYSVKKALAINFAVSSTILIGVALGYFALVSHELEVVLLALAAGFFLQVVFHDLLPKHDEYENMQTFFTHAFLVFIGVILMGLVSSAASEGHIHGGDSHDHAHEEEVHNQHEDEHHEGFFDRLFHGHDHE
jgi:zinc and cadmium transporter